MSNAGSNRSWVLPTGSPRSDGGNPWGRRPFVARRRGYQVDRALTVLDQWMEDAALLELGDKLTEGRPKTGGWRASGLPRPGDLRPAAGAPQSPGSGAAGPGRGLAGQRPDLPPGGRHAVAARHVSKRFWALAAQVGLPPIKLHSARHSAISVMGTAGVDRDLRKRRPGTPMTRCTTATPISGMTRFAMPPARPRATP